MPLGRAWCPGGEVFLRLVGTSEFRHVGVAPPYEVSALSYLKQSYLGYAGYLLLAFAVVFAAFFTGGLAARAARSGVDPVLGGFLGLAVASLAMFYLYAWTPAPPFSGLLLIGAVVAIAIGARWKAPDLARSVWRAQKAPVYAWFLTALLVFTVLHLGATGSGSGNRHGGSHRRSGPPTTCCRACSLRPCGLGPILCRPRRATGRSAIARR